MAKRKAVVAAPFGEDFTREIEMIPQLRATAGEFEYGFSKWSVSEDQKNRTITITLSRSSAYQPDLPMDEPKGGPEDEQGDTEVSV